MMERALLRESDTRARVLAEARCWIGTPYRHQASLKGVGADCLGLLRGVWRTIYGAEPERIAPYTPDWSEYDGKERLMAGAARHLYAIALAGTEPGDVLAFRMRERGPVKHVGILGRAAAGHATLVHAYGGRAVTETALSVPWERRIAGAFRFPEVG